MRRGRPREPSGYRPKGRVSCLMSFSDRRTRRVAERSCRLQRQLVLCALLSSSPSTSRRADIAHSTMPTATVKLNDGTLLPAVAYGLGESCRRAGAILRRPARSPSSLPQITHGIQAVPKSGKSALRLYSKPWKRVTSTSTAPSSTKTCRPYPKASRWRGVSERMSLSRSS